MASESKDFGSEAGPSRRFSRSQTFGSFGSPPISPTGSQGKISDVRDPRITNKPRHTDTQITNCSSIIETHWASQCVLALDGGGIRGYSSLLILKRLMEIIGTIEERHDASVSSSYHPDNYRRCQNNNRCIDGPEVKDPGDACRFIPCHYFDFVGGTSTGGLISVMLGRLRMGVDEALAEYETLADEIFGHPRLFCYRSPLFWMRGKYSGTRMNEVINNVVLRRLSPRQLDVGGDTFSSTPRLCKTVCIAYNDKPMMATNVVTSGPYVFRSYDHWPQSPNTLQPLERNPGYAHTIPIVDIARATSAAPMYFDNVIIQNRKFGDGGFGTNNPAQELMEEVIQMSNRDNGAIKVFVSIGTGLSEISRFSNKFKELRTWINAAKKLATDSEKTHLAMLSSTGMSKIPYFRFNVGMKHDYTIAQDTNMESPITSNAVLSDVACEEFKDGDQISNSTDEDISKKKTSKTLGSMKLDEWKTQGGLRMRKQEDTTLETIRHYTAAYLQSQGVTEELTKVAEILVEIRRERSKGPLWKMVSTGLQYRCPVVGCAKGMKRRDCIENLKTHLIRRHEMSEDSPERKRELERKLEAGQLRY